MISFFLTKTSPALIKNFGAIVGSGRLRGDFQTKLDLVRRGYHANTRHCPETRKQANGWSRHGRIKALPKVADPAYRDITLCGAKAQTRREPDPVNPHGSKWIAP
jgi:hypothetical protein